MITTCINQALRQNAANFSTFAKCRYAQNEDFEKVGVVSDLYTTNTLACKYMYMYIGPWGYMNYMIDAHKIVTCVSPIINDNFTFLEDLFTPIATPFCFHKRLHK